MRRITIAIGTTLAGLVLLFSWPTSLNRSVTTGTAAPGAPSASGDAATSGSPTPVATAPVTVTYDGAAASTRYGDVQVRITVTDGVLTSAEAIAFPDHDRHDQQINAYAIPILDEAATTAQSAAIDMVSGATVTSRGYVQSLQDALDQAGLR